MNEIKKVKCEHDWEVHFVSKRFSDKTIMDYSFFCNKCEEIVYNHISVKELWEKKLETQQ